MEKNNTIKTNTKKSSFLFPIFCAVAGLATINLALNFYNIAQKKKIKFYNHQEIEMQVTKAAYKKAQSNTNAFYQELIFLGKQIKEDEENLKKEPSARLEAKIKKKRERLNSKFEDFQKIFLNSLTTITEEMVTEKLPKALESIRKKERCQAIIPINGRLFIRDTASKIYSPTRGIYLDMELENCIDPKDDVTKLILEELNIEIESDKAAAADKEGNEKDTEKKAITQSGETQKEGE